MPKWYYGKAELRKTPSIVDGLDPITEARYRRDGARFIHEIGNKLGLQSETKATGIIYFHRFYMFHSFRGFPRYVTACCCLFLAGKVEETPKKCKDIIKNAQAELTDEQFAQFGDDPREEVMTLERILLQTVRFDLQVDNPYRYIVKYAKSLKGNKEKLQNIVQSAWTFVNDSLCTTLCLQWEPEIIAIALMYLASKLSKFEVQDWVGRTSKHSKWWDVFVEGLSIDLLEDICHQVLDLYSSPAASRNSSPPAEKRSASKNQSRESAQPSTPVKVQKTESPSSRTPPLTSAPTKPVEVVKTAPMSSIPVPTATVVAVTPPVMPAMPAMTLPTVMHASPAPTVAPPVVIPPSNPPQPPPAPPASMQFAFAPQPPVTIAYQAPPSNQSNKPPMLHPPPLPPPAAAQALQVPVPHQGFQSFPPHQQPNPPFQQNYQQYPPMPTHSNGSHRPPPSNHPNGPPPNHPNGPPPNHPNGPPPNHHNGPPPNRPNGPPPNHPNSHQRPMHPSGHMNGPPRPPPNHNSPQFRQGGPPFRQGGPPPPYNNPPRPMRPNMRHHPPY